MAKVIIDDNEAQLISGTYPVLKIVLTGLVSGIIYLLLSFGIKQLIGSADIAGNIATVLVIISSIILMTRLHLAQPLFTALAVASVSWGLAQLTAELPVIEVIGWSLLIYVLSFVIFSWISRCTKFAPVIALMVVTIIVIRLAFVL
jgi:hypothetical protein